MRILRVPRVPGLLVMNVRPWVMGAQHLLWQRHADMRLFALNALEGQNILKYIQVLNRQQI